MSGWKWKGSLGAWEVWPSIYHFNRSLGHIRRVSFLVGKMKASCQIKNLWAQFVIMSVFLVIAHAAQ